jgi:ubiquinone/menaquinone biosynthesis C-methylase UbiE
LVGRVLELGFGPGHLQVSLLERGLPAFGLDESRQMSRLARHRLRRKGFPANLTRACAEHLPFPAIAFDTVVAAFPTEYIFDALTLGQIQRVLVPDGKLVIVPAAWITGKGFLERLAAWLFKVTGQAGAIEGVIHAIQSRLQAGGFEVRHELVELPGSRVLVIIASRSSAVPIV